MSCLRLIPVVMHGVFSKLGSCSYRDFGRGLELLIYKILGSSLIQSRQLLFLFRLEEAYISFFFFIISIFYITHRQSYCDNRSPFLLTTL
jgi:hypothetical protein